MNDKGILYRAAPDRRFREIILILLASVMLCCMAGGYITEIPSMAEKLPVCRDMPEGAGGVSAMVDVCGKVLPETFGERKNLELVLSEDMLSRPFESEERSEAAAETVSLPAEEIRPEASVNVPAAVPEDAVTVPDQTVPEEEAAVPGEEEEILPGEEDTNQEADPAPFVCGGFLCSGSGMIIGCEGVNLTDGVLCLPSDAACTGVAAGAFAPLGSEVMEIYIPANITLIENGAFDGLTELMYIEVHPANPVYGSSGGELYEKQQVP